MTVKKKEDVVMHGMQEEVAKKKKAKISIDDLKKMDEKIWYHLDIIDDKIQDIDNRIRAVADKVQRIAGRMGVE